MNLSHLAGNNQIKRQFAHETGKRGLGHAYILSGPKGSGRHTLAAQLSACAVCRQEETQRPCGKCVPCKKVSEGIHPDVLTIQGADGKPITVDQVRALRSDAYICPNEAPRKIYLLEQADRMNPQAQNAMLKLLEDGPPYAMFLLLAENSMGLLNTIRSRCELLSLTPVSPAECETWLRTQYPERDPAQVHQAALDCQGVLGRAITQLDGADAEQNAIRTQATQLARVLESGDELTLFQTVMPLEKAPREELSGILTETVVEISRILPGSPQKRRLLKAVEILRNLSGAMELNANAGQLTGWLCAAMFQDQSSRK